jgi:methionyl-tRNA formyltransferase
MRILFLGNNWVAWQALRWLKETGEDVAGLVWHPEPKRKFGPEMLEAFRMGNAPGTGPAAEAAASEPIDGSRLGDPGTLERVRALGCDIALSVLFDYVVKPDFISLFPKGVVNVHPALLPYNRGQYPNVWSILEGTPSGATLHYIDAGIDTGDIIAQKRVEVEAVDTGETLYRKLERASLDLIRETWPALKAGTAPRRPQGGEKGTYHRTRDVDQVDEILPDATYTGRQLIDLLRARTFPPYKGAFMRVGGRKVYLRLRLEYGEDG